MKKGIDYTGIGVVCFCHDGDGKYLVGLRSGKSRDERLKWGPVGSGAVERGERLEDSVKREVKEECGADALEIEHIGFGESFRGHEDGETHWVFFHYKVRIDPNSARNTEPNMFLEHRWCMVDEIPEPQHSEFPNILKKYKDIL